MAIRVSRTVAVLLTGLLGAAGSAAAAQTTPAAPATPGPSAPAAIDVNKLPVSVNRIQRQLRQTTVREEHESPLRLRYVVDVYGIAPRIEIVTPNDNVLSGPVPWSGPTHRDMLEVMTPQEYRAPAADFGALMRWLADKAKSKKK